MARLMRMRKPVHIWYDVTAICEISGPEGTLPPLKLAVHFMTCDTCNTRGHVQTASHDADLGPTNQLFLTDDYRCYYHEISHEAGHRQVCTPPSPGCSVLSSNAQTCPNALNCTVGENHHIAVVQPLQQVES